MISPLLLNVLGRKMKGAEPEVNFNSCLEDGWNFMMEQIDSRFEEISSYL